MLTSLLQEHQHVLCYPQIYTTFYCRINEPSYIKHLKLDILAAIADETNAYDIATELTEYVNDIDEKLARKAIKTVGQIALEVRLYQHWLAPQNCINADVVQICTGHTCGCKRLL